MAFHLVRHFHYCPRWKAIVYMLAGIGIGMRPMGKYFSQKTPVLFRLRKRDKQDVDISYSRGVNIQSLSGDIIKRPPFCRHLAPGLSVRAAAGPERADR